MIAEIISVGTELLLGKVANTDAQIISQELAARGIFVRRHVVVGDNEERLREAVTTARSRADIIITTGGLGPTYDDMTKQTVSGCFGRRLTMHRPSLERIHDYFRQVGRPCTPNNEQQAMLPENCTVLDNGMGTAPGCAFEQDGVHVLMLPGPPGECRGMLTNAALPYLEKLSDGVLISRFIRFFGIGESALEQRLRHMMVNSLNPTIAPYAADCEVYLRVTAAAPTADGCEQLLEPVVRDICEMFPEYVYGVDVDSLESAVSDRLRERGAVLAVAESCTGGLVAKRMTDLTGATALFWGGVTSYSNASKETLLCVPHALLDEHGAVSEQAAAAMAEGIYKLSGADYALSVTGLCGPDADERGNPPGTVYIGLSVNGGTARVKHVNVRGRSREHSRGLAAGYALKFLLDSITS